MIEQVTSLKFIDFDYIDDTWKARYEGTIDITGYNYKFTATAEFGGDETTFTVANIAVFVEGGVQHDSVAKDLITEAIIKDIENSLAAFDNLLD